MDLTTLSRAKAYLQGVAGATAADALLSSLIARASDVACNFTGRTFQRASFAPLKTNGSGSATLMLPANPIIAVTALAIGAAAVQESPDGVVAGYQNDSKFLYLMGGQVFPRGLRNVSVTFSAGYSTEQSGFVPATTPFTLTPVIGSSIGPDGMPASTSGPAVVDRGVETAAGATMTARAVGSNLSTGQYTFGDGTYTFAAADAGAAVVMSYDFVPGAVEQAVLELVGTWLKKRSNLGISSMTLGAGESVTFLDKEMPASVRAALNLYRFVVSP